MNILKSDNKYDYNFTESCLRGRIAGYFNQSMPSELSGEVFNENRIKNNRNCNRGKTYSN